MSSLSFLIIPGSPPIQIGKANTTSGKILSCRCSGRRYSAPQSIDRVARQKDTDGEKAVPPVRHDGTDQKAQRTEQHEPRRPRMTYGAIWTLGFRLARPQREHRAEGQSEIA